MTAWLIKKRRMRLTLGRVEHLHMDVLEEFNSDWKGNVDVALSALVTVSTQISPDLREVALWIPEEAVATEDDYSWLARSLPWTFFNRETLPRLEGFVLFLELPSSDAAEEFQEGFSGKQGYSSTTEDIVLGSDPGYGFESSVASQEMFSPAIKTEDVDWYDTAVVVTEGGAFGCQCHFAGKMVRGYMRRYFGES